VFVKDRRSLRATDAPVVEAVREADKVPGEAVAADVSRLPNPLLVDLLCEALEQWAAVACATGIVLAVGADEE
jgi:hypothetical protein